MVNTYDVPCITGGITLIRKGIICGNRRINVLTGKKRREDVLAWYPAGKINLKYAVHVSGLYRGHYADATCFVDELLRGLAAISISEAKRLSRARKSWTETRKGNHMTITARHLETLGNDAGVISSYEYQQAQRVEMVRISDVKAGDILVIDGDDYQLTGMYIIPEGWVIEAVSKAGTLYMDLVVSETGATPWVERATTG